MKNLVFIVLLPLALLVGCGSDSKPKIEGENPDFNDGNLTPGNPGELEKFQVRISGTISGINLKNTTVKIYEFSSGIQGVIAGSVNTSGSSFYSKDVELSGSTPSVMVCANGGSYTEIASLQVITLADSDQICAVSTLNKVSSKTINLSPWTNIATALTIYKTKQGTSIKTAASTSNYLISQLYGFDVSTTIARSIDGDMGSNLTYSSVSASVLAAGVSQLTLNQAKDAGLAGHTNVYSTYAYFKTAYKDVESDGKLDGKGKTNPFGPSVDLGLGDKVFNGGSYSGDMARGAVQFIASSANDSIIQVADIISEQQRLASSNDPLLGADIIAINEEGLDSVPPIIINSNLENDQLLRSEIQVEATTTDNVGLSQVELYVDGELIGTNQGAILSVVYDTSILTDGQHTFKVIARDLLGNVTEKSFEKSVINADAYITKSSPSLVNNSNYTFIGEVYSGTLEVTGVKINNIVASNVGGEIQVNLVLNEGLNSVEYQINTSDGRTFTSEFDINVDSVAPTLETTDIASNYVVEYEFINSEIVLFPLRFQIPYHPFYIDKFHEALNGAAVTQSGLMAMKQPYIRFKAFDQDNGQGISTETSNLKASYEYYQDGVLKRQESLSLKDNEFKIIPIVEEYLVENWAAFAGQHSVKVIIEDEAGNVLENDFPFLSYLSNPTIDSGSGVAASGDGVIQLSGDDLDKLDTIEFTVNGNKYSPDSLENLLFNLDPTTLSQGDNFGIIRGYQNGELVYEQRIDFKVDMTPPEVFVDTLMITKETSPVITGLADDPESNIISVNVDSATANYNPFNQNFDFEFTNLEDGIHTFQVEALNSVGLTGIATGQIKKDTLLPRRTLKYPGDPNYEVNYQNNPNNPPVRGRYQFLDGGQSVFYLNADNMYLNGMQPSVANLMNGKYIFINCFYSDRYSGGAETPRGDLKVTYSYSHKQIGKPNVEVFEDKPLINNDGNYVLPLTAEFLTEEFANNATAQDFHSIKVRVTDNAGNVDFREYLFKINYDPNSTYPLQ